jgi:hypothetical protein
MGERIDVERAQFMRERGVGFTTTYNRLKDQSVNDAGVLALRNLHEELDRAVLDAYGWHDVQVPPYCSAAPSEIEAFEDEVLDRLFELNETGKCSSLGRQVRSVDNDVGGTHLFHSQPLWGARRVDGQSDPTARSSRSDCSVTWIR